MVGSDVRISRGDIWWADFEDPEGSEPGYRRPVVVLQSNYLNRTALNTVVVVSLTGNLARAGLAGNVLLTKRKTGLPKDSVANVTQIATVDKDILTEKCGHLDADSIGRVAEGARMVLDL